jgi:hypothetical protein
MRLGLVAIACIVSASISSGAAPPRLDEPPSPRPANAAQLGVTSELSHADLPFILYVPHAWTNHREPVLTVHFHSAPSFTISEHLRRGASNPIAILLLGSGSAAYAKPFTNSATFGGVIETIERELSPGKAKPTFRFAALELSSFSAGYGAVRELLKSKTYFDRIKSIVLLDSFYGGLEGSAANRVVLREHVEIWVPFAQAAMREEKRFLVTTSQIHTPNYAATYEVAAALIKRLGLEVEIVSTNQAPPKITLLRRADSGHLHIWSYSGTNGPAHTAHVQHMADFWRGAGF